MDPDSFISGNFYLIRLFIFCYICNVKNTVRECSQFIQNKEQNVNYSVLYRNYLFDTRRVIAFKSNALTSSSHKDSFPHLIAICQIINPQCELFQPVLPFAQYLLAVFSPLVCKEYLNGKIHNSS